MVVAIVDRQHVNPNIEFLVVGGKEVPGSEVVGHISDIVFSPDGKHYAAGFQNANYRQYVISDGKKGLEYPSVNNLAFTADSSKLFYQAYDPSSGARYFVFGGEESERIPQWIETVFAPVGGHVATDGAGFITMDGQILKFPNVNPQATQASALSFSPDASHYAFVLHDRGGITLYVDGVARTGYGLVSGGPLDNISTRPYIFSPDSKHIAYFCRSSDPAAGDDTYLCLDDKAVRLGGPGYYANLTFSGDSNHLFWTRNKPQGEIRIFLDGKPVQDGFPMSTGGFQKETWQIGPDGNLLVLLQNDISLNRIRITPASDSGLGALVGDDRAMRASGD
jgi:WD40 repeat protein